MLYPALSQVEHVIALHPVYEFLSQMEIRGFTPHSSLTYLPLEKKQIVSMLNDIRKNENKLSSAEMSVLQHFEKEFEIIPRENTVLIYSDTDTNQIIFSGLISDREKFIYHYDDKKHNVNFLPLANFEAIFEKSDTASGSVTLGNLGFRLHGTLSALVGYNLQVTNGAKISGDRNIALENRKLKHNVKFSMLNSDFDFVESHIRFQYDWFYAIIGRENRHVGAGIMQSLFLSDNAPPMDGFSLGARFSNFEYRFDHFSMLAYAVNDSTQVGFTSIIPPKYLSMHTFSYRPSWGELSYIQSITYSGRAAELAYLTPLSFSKSLEHSLHDRDKTMMGFFGTVRPIRNLQLKGGWMLEDIIISRIGTGYWSNKTAWNIGASFALPFSASIGAEYTRVEPYMFTHFNYQNNRTNDGVLIGTYLFPNSDEKAMLIRWFWGGRYPIILKLGYIRHGENITDSSGKIIRNVGGDPRYCMQLPRDSEKVSFLDGNLRENLFAQLSGGIELFRGFNLKATYSLLSESDKLKHNFYISINFSDF